MKYILGWTALTVLVAGSAVLSIFSSTRRSMDTCEGIEVSFTDSLRFLTAEDVKERVEKKYGICTGLLTDSVKLYRIEEILESESSVKGCEAWISNDRKLRIEISQRVPRLMFVNGKVSFYADNEGYIFPTQGKSVDVPHVSGSLPLTEGGSFRGFATRPEERRWIQDVIGLLDHVQSDRRWRGKIKEISANRNWDIYLKTGLGDERINIGYPDDLERKFSKLDDYYTLIVPARGEGWYRNVNIKYNKQIICRRDI